MDSSLSWINIHCWAFSLSCPPCSSIPNWRSKLDCLDRLAGTCSSVVNHTSQHSQDPGARSYSQKSEDMFMQV